MIPATVGSVDGVEANVSGLTAGSKDFNDVMQARLPIVFAFVLGLAFLLLLVTFRSVVVPLKAIVLNLLSVGAAYGVLTYVFQDGHGEKLLGFESIGGDHLVAAAVPLRDPVRPVDGLPRVHPQPDPRGGRPRDEHAERGRPRHQVDGGRRHQRGRRDGRGVLDLRRRCRRSSSSRWASASPSPSCSTRRSSAAVLLPAAMTLLGERNWYLPSWLEWIPRVRHDAPPEPEPEPVEERELVAV